MKKNAMLKIAAILLVAVLLTTCAISSTFAKYVTQGTETEAVARVAKWGVSVETTMTDLFKTSYGTDGKTVTSKADTAIDDDEANDLVVAPGTSNEIDVTKTVTNASAVEVSYAVTADVVVALDNWTVDTNTKYCPIVFTVDGNEYKNNDADALETEVASAIKTAYEAKDSFKIKWAWAFTGNDANDTKLGNATTPASIAISITPTITQTGPAVAE